MAATATASAAAAAHAEPGGRVVGKVTVTEADGKPAAGADVIVYVVGFTEPPRRPGPTTIAAEGPQVRPRPRRDHRRRSGRASRTAIRSCTTCSRSRRPRKFDLGSFKKGESKDKQFPAPGVIDVYCNIHPEMAATILVLPNRRHTRARPDGSYVLDGVPPGTWTVFAYTRRVTKPASAKVTVDGRRRRRRSIWRSCAVPRPSTSNKYGEKYTGSRATYR